MTKAGVIKTWQSQEQQETPNPPSPNPIPKQANKRNEPQTDRPTQQKIITSWNGNIYKLG